MKNINLKKLLIFSFCFFAISFGFIKFFYFSGQENPTDHTSQNWMKSLPNSALITSVNIPGTHDSGTHRVTPFTGIYAQCQSKSITDQLNSGIRYLDLRIDEKGIINHAGISCWKSLFKRLYISDVENYISEFLKKNPSETVIVQIKSEGDGDCINVVNNKLVKSAFCYTGNKNIRELTLGDLRGKFVIFSRQSEINNAYNYYSWEDNVSFCNIWLDRQKGYLQDKYNNSIPGKKESINNFYTKIWQDQDVDKKPVLNFTSFTKIPIPLSVLYSGINDYMSKYIDSNNNKKFGFVLMDNPSNSLIQKLYKTNFSRNL